MSLKDGLTVVAIGAAGYVAWKAFRSGQGVVEFIKDPENPINQGANSVVQKVTGNEVDTIGTHIFAFLNPGKAESGGIGQTVFPGFEGDVTTIEEAEIIK